MYKKIIPIILCGGNGSRLLPFLKEKAPKQFLNIVDGNYNLLQQTLVRFSDTKLFHRPIIIAARQHKDLVKQSIDILGMPVHTIVLEPTSRNTGPAIASALSLLIDLYYDDETPIFVAPIDHYLSDVNAFNKKLSDILLYLKNCHKEHELPIVSFFVKPKSVEKNYGHLVLGNDIFNTQNKTKIYKVQNFIEKPSHDEINTLPDNFMWNSGMYFMSLASGRNIFMSNAPHVWAYSFCATSNAGMRLLSKSKYDEATIILDEFYFSKNPDISFDKIITTPYKTESIVCTDVGMEWEDIGLLSGIKRLEMQLHQNRKKCKKNITLNTKLFIDDAIAKIE